MIRRWRAAWVSFDASPHGDLGVFKFRCEFSLDEVPLQFVVRVSADQRYKLYCNGSLVTFGPQRGDAQHWFYEVLDVAPFLVPGPNTLEALVWSFGRWAPMAQCTVRTGFVFEAPEDFDFLSTPGDWQVARLEGWDFDMMHSSVGDFYIDVGPGEIIDAAHMQTEFGSPYVICHAEERSSSGGGTPWMLIPRSIPPMRYVQRKALPAVRRGAEFVGSALEFANGETALLDFQELLCAYPRISVDAPCRLRITYAESLWNTDGTKGNRDEVEGKEMRGYQDVFIAGDQGGVFEPLWWRTFRYLQIETTEFPAIDNQKREVIVDVFETGYPIQVESSFTADESCVEKIWEVSLRTAERCAGETYFDCPYYEQLQYIGDTRIQALIGYYLGRDRALQRNAVETLGWSILEDGLTQSRYPSRQAQVIPPFSLWWILMLWDQMLYDDPGARPEFVSSHTINGLLEGFRELQRRELQYWQFADWVESWRWGVPPGGANATVHRLTLDVATCVAMRYQEFLEHGEWNEWGLHDSRQLEFAVSDDPPSEHAEALHLLCRALCGHEISPWPADALEKSNAVKCTYYFQYYKHLAMFGRIDAPFDYMKELQPWRQMIEDGLTTFAENPEPTRSDCHAWSAHPILGFFQIVAGVTSLSPGWKKVRVMPHPGSLKRFDARIAHPDGDFRVTFEQEKFTIDSPVPFEFMWRDMTKTFESGLHKIG